MCVCVLLEAEIYKLMFAWEVGNKFSVNIHALHNTHPGGLGKEFYLNGITEAVFIHCLFEGVDVVYAYRSAFVRVYML